MKIVKKVCVGLLIVLALLQFYRPEKNNAETRDITAFEKEMKPGAEITAILEANCYDCHSNKTVYPWYAEVAPISIWIDHHVEDGVKHFNVSNWNSYTNKKKDHKLEELIEEVEEGKMPLDSYTWLHGTMSTSEKEALLAWAKKARESYH
ncbi:heme-binding domain-containing protein [uncultured Algibacter sp.]|uniref:heme-binding domain-containing protein n=1 Tax=uncultured Algibacter sp. TaxID=298659 RepID=UPI00263A1128|nr:heme-binding domain-containing protein [uncultured Algibacter sp.]